MPTTPSSTPILRGRGGAALRHDDGALTLRRGDEETRIPLEAVRAVLADDQSVTVELRAPEGAPPVIHRVEGVSAAAASMFATALDAALAEVPVSDSSFDGAALVTTRSLRTPRTPVSAGEKAKGLAWAVVALGPGLGALIAMSVLVVIRGEPGALVLSVLMGIVALLFNVVSAVTMERGYQMWRLPRYGITVTAVRTSPFGKSGTYQYTDQSGASHNYSRQAYASEIEISYHPDDPGTNVGVYPVVVRVLVTLSSLLLWGATISLIYLMILMGRNV
ncbi:hypothetical protein [Streptomyces sp. NPDC001717]|uniref:hypothetical protein n=1 Tax=Streptomyces sp. NPDC001717 TaxID=3364604 RepID=UPI0036817CD8